MKNEQSKDLQKGRHPLPFSACLAYLVVCTLLLTGVSFSKYVTRSNAADSARVAKGIVTVVSTSNPTLEVRNEAQDYPLDFAYFTFNVSNHNSEVAIGYDIVVTLKEALHDGVTVSLSTDGANPIQSDTTSSDGLKYKFSNAGTFKAGEEKTITHMLIFNIDFTNFADEDTYTYNIDISIESHQID